jgi:hypothetical protein
MCYTLLAAAEQRRLRLTAQKNDILADQAMAKEASDCHCKIHVQAGPEIFAVLRARPTDI